MGFLLFYSRVPGVLDNNMASVFVQKIIWGVTVCQVCPDHVAVHRQCLIRLHCYVLIVK
jgi:hypothetical protein